MTPDEKSQLHTLFDKIDALKDRPRDAEAETLIADATRAIPHASYVLAQTVLLQNQALEQADQRLHELETRLVEFEKAKEQPTRFLGGLGAPFLSGRRTASGVPSVSRVPHPQAETRQSPWTRGPQPPYPAGNSFLGSALSTAAGVAGGVFLFQGISSLFQGGPPVDDVAASAASELPAADVAPSAFDSHDNVIREADYSDPGFDGSDFGGGDDGGWA